MQSYKSDDAEVEMFFKRNDMDDEYNRYMQEREAERNGEQSKSYSESEYYSNNGVDSYHESDCHEETCEYVRNEKEYKRCVKKIAPHLLAGERILWTSIGTTAKAANPKHGSAVGERIVGVMTLAFTIFWTSLALQASIFMALFALPFFAVSIMSILGKNVSPVYYAITDMRVIEIGGRRTYGFSLEGVRNVTYRDEGKGKGTIFYTVPNPAVSMNLRTLNKFIGTIPQTFPRAFWLVSDAQQGYSILKGYTSQ